MTVLPILYVIYTYVLTTGASIITSDHTEVVMELPDNEIVTLMACTSDANTWFTIKGKGTSPDTQVITQEVIEEKNKLHLIFTHTSVTMIYVGVLCLDFDLGSPYNPILPPTCSIQELLETEAVDNVFKNSSGSSNVFNIYPREISPSPSLPEATEVPECTPECIDATSNAPGFLDGEVIKPGAAYLATCTQTMRGPCRCPTQVALVALCVVFGLISLLLTICMCCRRTHQKLYPGSPEAEYSLDVVTVPLSEQENISFGRKGKKRQKRDFPQKE
ncbi:uncharacterized protein [Cherax quadricarinatus]|nr:uncharacterized protein LOC128691172 [Cherax quadricarinatus]